ncbi:Kynureninase OS=Streptomyces griseomycini OX=66895 GN=kynU PE=3 SV=1 [Streptomyces griseomycini]
MSELALHAEKLDAGDELAGVRAQFVLDDAVYLDGNSLRRAPDRRPRARRGRRTPPVGVLRIRSWEESGWWTAPERIGDRIAPLIGAAAGQIVVGDSTSVNVFKALVGARTASGGAGRAGVTRSSSTRPPSPPTGTSPSPRPG